MKPVLAAALVAALCLPAISLGQGFASSGWVSASASRAAPATRYAGADCGPADTACQAKAWQDLLTEHGEAPLSALEGGRSYRFMIDRYAFGLGLKIVRLDVDASGKATFTNASGRRRGGSHAISAETLAAFDAAFAASGFDKAGAQTTQRTCDETVDETVFEAIVGGRYKIAVEPCGDPLKLDKAMAVLDGEG